MGRITIFVASQCPLCPKVEQRLRSAAARALEAAPSGSLHVNVVDVSRDSQRARQCVRLTGSRKVPHVFFNSTYFGDAQFVCETTSGDALLERLGELALEPDELFPPPVPTAMIKVTSSTAFSGQPTPEQVATLACFGFRSTICTRTVAEVGSQYHCKQVCTTSRTGVAFFHTPLPEACGCRRGETLLRVLHAVKTVHYAPAPVLVHDSHGQRASFVVLMHAAWAAQAGRATVAKWARELKQDWEAYTPRLAALVPIVLRIFRFMDRPEQVAPDAVTRSTACQSLKSLACSPHPSALAHAKSVCMASSPGASPREPCAGTGAGARSGAASASLPRCPARAATPDEPGPVGP